MLNKFHGLLLVIAVVISLYSINNIISKPSSVEARGGDGQTTPQAVPGPGNCGNFVNITSCQTYWKSEGINCGYGKVAYSSEFQSQVNYQFGKQMGSAFGTTIVCKKPGENFPPATYPACITQNTCG